MKDYAGYSFWLETSEDDLTPRPALEGSLDVDVAILGAGYTGLWTAYYLLRRDPGLRIAVLERDIAGFGASGRNGGWCIGLFPLSAHLLQRRFGREAARELELAMMATVESDRSARASRARWSAVSTSMALVSVPVAVTTKLRGTVIETSKSPYSR